MALRDLLAKFTIVANPEALDKVNAGLDKTKAKFHDVGESGTNQLERIAKSAEGLKHILEAFAVFEIAKGLTEMAERFAKLGLELKVTAESLGLNVVEFQKLSFAAGQSAVSQEQLSHGLLRLSRALYEAKTGSSEAQDVFAHLGVPPGQISQLKSADQALFLLSTRLQTIQNPIDKLALVQKTLGRGSMEMVAFLSQGPAAIQARMQAAARDGLVLSESQVNGLEKMQHAFERFEAKIKVIMATIVEPLAPVIEKLVDDFIRLFNANREWINLGLEKFLYGVGFALGFIDGAVTGLIERFKAFSEHGNFSELFGSLFVDGALALGIRAIIGAVQTLIPLFATLAAEVAPIVAAAVVIHDLAILADKKQGSLSERASKTIIGRGVINAAEAIDEVRSEGVDRLVGVGLAHKFAALDSKGQFKGGSASGVTTNHNTYNFYGADALAEARRLNDEQKRQAHRDLRGNQPTNIPGN